MLRFLGFAALGAAAFALAAPGRIGAQTAGAAPETAPNAAAKPRAAAPFEAPAAAPIERAVARAEDIARLFEASGMEVFLTYAEIGHLASFAALHPAIEGRAPTPAQLDAFRAILSRAQMQAAMKQAFAQIAAKDAKAATEFFTSAAGMRFVAADQEALRTDASPQARAAARDAFYKEAAASGFDFDRPLSGSPQMQFAGARVAAEEAMARNLHLLAISAANLDRGAQGEAPMSALEAAAPSLAPQGEDAAYRRAEVQAQTYTYMWVSAQGLSAAERAAALEFLNSAAGQAYGARLYQGYQQIVIGYFHGLGQYLRALQDQSDL